MALTNEEIIELVQEKIKEKEEVINQQQEEILELNTKVDKLEEQVAAVEKEKEDMKNQLNEAGESAAQREDLIQKLYDILE